MKRYIALILFLLPLVTLRAQEKEYMYEVGTGVGTSWGYGDINRSSALYNPALAVSLILKYNVNLRWAIATDFSTSGLKGDTRDFDNAFPNGEQYSYNAHLWQCCLRPEFTFWNYGWGNDYREKHRIAPFLTAGMGFGFTSGHQDNAFVFSIPLGAGIKWKMAPRWNAQLTAIFSKTFGDGIDGLDDPYKVGTTPPINTDWAGSLILGITFDFKERCIECHNQNN